MNRLPNGGKVVIVDDRFEEVLPLIRILNTHSVSVNYFTGKKDELPVIPLEGVRLFFLDLRFSPSIDTKTIVSNACNILKNIIGEKNGPYLLITWSTTGDEYKSELVCELQDKKFRPEYVLCLSKAEYFETVDGDLYEELDDIEKILINAGVDNIDAIMNKITKRMIREEDESKKIFISSNLPNLQNELYEGLKTAGLLSLFILWENTIRNSAHKVVNEIYKQIPDSISVEKKLSAMAYYLAKNKLDKQFDNVEVKEQLLAALMELNELYRYFYESDVVNISVNDFLPMNIQKNAELIPSQAKFNSWKLIASVSKLDEPGTIYEDKDKAFEFFKLIKDFDNTEKYNERQRKLTNDEKLLFIKININGECETAQTKYPVIRVIPGVLVPCNTYNEYVEAGVLKKAKDKSPDYIFNEFESFEYNKTEYYMILNINQCTYFNKVELENMSALFKLQRKYYLKIRQAISEDFAKQGIDLYK